MTQPPTPSPTPAAPPRPAPVWRNPVPFIVAAMVSYISLIGQFLALMIVTGGAIIALPVLAIMPIGAVVLDRLAIRKTNPSAGWPLPAVAPGFTATVASPSLSTGTAP